MFLLITKKEIDKKKAIIKNVAIYLEIDLLIGFKLIHIISQSSRKILI